MLKIYGTYLLVQTAYLLCHSKNYNSFLTKKIFLKKNMNMILPRVIPFAAIGSQCWSAYNEYFKDQKLPWTINCFVRATNTPMANISFDIRVAHPISDEDPIHYKKNTVYLRSIVLHEENTLI